MKSTAIQFHGKLFPVGIRSKRLQLIAQAHNTIHQKSADYETSY